MRSSLTTSLGVLLVIELSNSFLICVSAKRSSQTTASFLGREVGERRTHARRRHPHYDKPARSWILRALSHHTDDES